MCENLQPKEKWRNKKDGQRQQLLIPFDWSMTKAYALKILIKRNK